MTRAVRLVTFSHYLFWHYPRSVFANTHIWIFSIVDMYVFGRRTIHELEHCTCNNSIQIHMQTQASNGYTFFCSIECSEALLIIYIFEITSPKSTIWLGIFMRTKYIEEHLIIDSVYKSSFVTWFQIYAQPSHNITPKPLHFHRKNCGTLKFFKCFSVINDWRLQNKKKNRLKLGFHCSIRRNFTAALNGQCSLLRHPSIHVTNISIINSIRKMKLFELIHSGSGPSMASCFQSHHLSIKSFLYCWNSIN